MLNFLLEVRDMSLASFDPRSELKQLLRLDLLVGINCSLLDHAKNEHGSAFQLDLLLLDLFEQGIH